MASTVTVDGHCSNSNVIPPHQRHLLHFQQHQQQSMNYPLSPHYHNHYRYRYHRCNSNNFNKSHWLRRVLVTLMMTMLTLMDINVMRHYHLYHNNVYESDNKYGYGYGVAADTSILPTLGAAVPRVPLSIGILFGNTTSGSTTTILTDMDVNMTMNGIMMAIDEINYGGGIPAVYQSSSVVLVLTPLLIITNSTFDFDNAVQHFATVGAPVIFGIIH
jgi:hypothetical protein